MLMKTSCLATAALTVLLLASSDSSVSPQSAHAATKPQTPVASLQPTDPYFSVADLPVLDPLSISGFSSSYDRHGGNNDGNSGAGFLFKEPNGQSVIFDHIGPGVVTRIWLAGFYAPNDELHFYLNGSPTPTYSESVSTLFSELSPPYLGPLVEDNGVANSSGAWLDYVPIPFTRSLKITMSLGTTSSDPSLPGYWYQVDYSKFPYGSSTRSFTASQESRVLSAWNNAGAPPYTVKTPTVTAHAFNLAAHATATLLERSGAGIVDAVKLTIPGVPGNAADNYGRRLLDHLWIRAYWNHSAQPAISAPLGAFFGVGRWGANQTQHTILAGLRGRTLYAYFPMPFQSAARIELVSERDTVTRGITATIVTSPYGGSFQNIGLFHTQYRFTHTTTSDPFDVVALDARGAGKFIGLQMSISGNDDRTYLEGDDRIYIDGNKTPFLGTGTEDYFNGGGYFVFGPYDWPLSAYTGPEFSAPLDGQNLGSPWSGNSGNTGNISMVRYLMNGAINFRNHIVVEFQHGGGPLDDDPSKPWYAGGNQYGEYWTLAYYYSQPVSSDRLTDSLTLSSPASQRAHHYVIKGPSKKLTVTSGYDGNLTMLSSTATGYEVAGSSSFDLRIDPHNAGVILRRTFDQESFSQRAAVYVDGKYSGIWYVPGGNPYSLWRQSDFPIAPALTQGKSILHMLIVPERASAWNEFAYQAFSIVPTPVPPHLDLNGQSVTFISGARPLAIGISGPAAAQIPGSPIVALKPASRYAEQWRLTAVGNGVYAIVNVDSGLILSATPSNSGTQLSEQAWPDSLASRSPDLAQLWNIRPVKDDLNIGSNNTQEVRITSMADGKSLQWLTSSTQLKPELVLGKSVDAAGLWKLAIASRPSPVPLRVGSSYTIASQQGFGTITSNPSAQEEWTLRSAGGGYYNLLDSENPHLALASARNKLITVRFAPGNAAQMWQIQRVDDGISDNDFRIVAKVDGLAVSTDVTGAMGAALSPWNASSSELWTFDPI